MRLLYRRHVTAKGFLYLPYRASALRERGGYIGGALVYPVDVEAERHPTSLALLGSALIGFAAIRRRKRA